MESAQVRAPSPPEPDLLQMNGTWVQADEWPPAAVQELQFIGTGVWDVPGIGADTMLRGAWYAAPDPARRAALGESVRESHGGLAKIIGVTPKTVREPDEDELEQRLIAKLDVSGQLRPGFLIRSLQDRKLPLFIKGLTALGRFDPEQVERAIQSDRPELLALACAAVGIDKSAFPTILQMVRDLNEGRPDGGAEGARRANGAFGPFSPDIAATAFRQAVSKV